MTVTDDDSRGPSGRDGPSNTNSRTVKRSKFDGRKYVYPIAVMREMRTFFDEQIGATLPRAQVLYWT